MLVDDLKVPRVLDVPSGSTDEDAESSFDESRASLLSPLGTPVNGVQELLRQRDRRSHSHAISMFRPGEPVNDWCE